MKRFLTKISYITLAFAFPLVSFAGDTPAASTGGGKTAIELLTYIKNIINLVVPIIIGAALLVFLWGVFKYSFSKDDKSRKESLNFIIWGIIALFVMVALWGLVNVLQSAFLSDANPSEPPKQEVESLKKELETKPANLTGGTPILDLIKEIGRIIEAAIPVVMLLAVLFIIWNIFRYAFSDSKNRAVFKNYIVWGVVALTVMAFVWSFVAILQQTVFEKGDPTAMGESEEAIEQLKSDPKQEGKGLQAPIDSGTGVNKIIIEVVDIVNSAIPILITLGILIFIWGVFKYVGSSSPKMKSEGLAMIGWGIVVLAIMGGVWYFVNLIAESTDISLEQQPTIRKENVSPDELIAK